MTVRERERKREEEEEEVEGVKSLSKEGKKGIYQVGRSGHSCCSHAM